MRNSVVAKNRRHPKARRLRRGQTLVEYAMIIGLISLVAISVLLVLGHQIQTLFTTVSSQMAQSSGSH
jgi:Flp pilus assembly pilin Flp